MIEILGFGVLFALVIAVLFALVKIPIFIARVFIAGALGFIRLARRFASWSARRGWKNLAWIARHVAALIQIALDLAVGLAFAISVYLKAALDRLRRYFRRPT